MAHEYWHQDPQDYRYGEPTPRYEPEDEGWDRRVSNVGQYVPFVDDYFTEQHIMSDPALRQSQKEAEIQRARVASVAALGIGLGAGYLAKGPLKAGLKAGARKFLQRWAKKDTARHMSKYRINPWLNSYDEVVGTDPYSDIKLSDQLQTGAMMEYIVSLPKNLQKKFLKAMKPVTEPVSEFSKYIQGGPTPSSGKMPARAWPKAEIDAIRKFNRTGGALKRTKATGVGSVKDVDWKEVAPYWHAQDVPDKYANEFFSSPVTKFRGQIKKR